MSKIKEILNKYEVREFRKKKFAQPVAQPVVQWVGGKRQLLDRYQDHFPKEIENYYEPFLGGAAVFFYLKSKNAISGDCYLSDINEELINLYTTITSSSTQVSELLNAINEKHSKEVFYEIRNVDRTKISRNRYEKTANVSDILSEVERAARMLYLNKTCFNALYRVNRDGLFNVPIGTSLKKDFSDHGNLKSSGEILSSANISVSDYKTILKQAKEGDFVFLDPPYEPVEGEGNFTSYTSSGFTFKDQVALKEECDRLDSIGVKFALSNSNAAKILDLYKDYTIEQFVVNRNLNSKAEKRKSSAKEILVKNY